MKQTQMVFVLLILLLTACAESTPTSLEKGSKINENTAENADNQGVTEENEFVIEVEYDPTLAALADEVEANKSKPKEQTKPIATTADDDDLENDSDDLPKNLSKEEGVAYDYDSEGVNPLEMQGNTGRNGKEEVKSNVGKSLFYVVAGAYKDLEVAKAKQKEVNKLGYKSEVLVFDSVFKTVCVARLESSEQAYRLAEDLVQKKIDAYVVIRKKSEK